ncbi:hypothetical protein GCM10009119_06160 [Algoriphagus jejuensis]|uniref:Glycine-rich domain-containing protein n=2 Tax=Algoriphagus jejuensis TaxID=419934 RepID=A0ABP3Y7Z0_9BACT
MGEVWGQTFTSNSNGDWTTTPGSRWTRTNPNSCATQYTSPPPTNASNISCAIDVIINHTITKTGYNQFAQRFRSLRINSTGYLNFTGNTIIEFTNNAYGAVDIIIDGGTLEIYDLNLINGAKIQVINGGKLIVRNNLTTSGSSTQIIVDTSSSISVGNDTTIASGHYLNINGSFSSKNLISNSAITTISSTANVTIANDFNLNSSGSLSLSGDAKLKVGRDFTSSGSASFASNGNTTLEIGRDFTQGSSGAFSFNNTNTSISRNFTNTGSGPSTFLGDAILDVDGNFSTSNGSIDFTNSTKVTIDGNVTQSAGGIYARDYSDIRVSGNINSTGGSYFGSSNSFLGVNGNHTISNYTASYNLSNNAQIQVSGTTTSPWNSLYVSDNACYKSNNRAEGVACVLCGETYIADGTFYVPAGVTQITIEVWGGGGAGASGNVITAGGGGGGYSRRTFSVTPGQALAVYVGKGGVANSALQANRDGALSYVSVNSSEPLPDRITNSIIFANGGKSPNPITSSGLGGSALSSSDLASRPNSVSYKGGDGKAPGSASGGGGSAAADNGPGNNGQDPPPNGGAKPSGKGGPGGNGNYYNNNGFQPTSGTYAGGGGGAYGITGSNKVGGSGAGGLVVISFTCPYVEPCTRVVDYGISGDYFIVEYFCDGKWAAPEGLDEYEVMLVGGGGAGGRTENASETGQAGGGGGGGAVVFPPKFIISGSGIPAGANYEIKVGAGGTGNSIVDSLRNGENSSFNNGVEYIAGGGAGGGISLSGSLNGLNGTNSSSGGGGAARKGSAAGIGGLGNTPGYNGGVAKTTGSSQNQYGGGGGGAGEVGFSVNASDGGPGGKGLLNTFKGISNYFGAGGGGGSASTSKTGGAGGTGGGGKGGKPDENAANGSANTGSGGGGGGGANKAGGDGGSGIVIIRYPVYRILPVEFLHFNATYQKADHSGLLIWSTAKEWENSHFEIERAVNTVKTWETIGRVEGNGYSDMPVEYKFIDTDLPKSGGNVFYRLKQIDYSARYSYSNTRAIHLPLVESEQRWIVYPNPTNGQDIQLVSRDNADFTEESSMQLSLSTSLGQQESIPGTTLVEINQNLSASLRQKPAGLYLLLIRWGNNLQTLRIVKN